MSKKTDELKAKLLAKRAPEAEPVLLSTGSTLLNLASSGRAEGGVAKGQYLLCVGDSSSGKSFLARTILAEASVNSAFDDYLLIHDDAENGCWFDNDRFFGPRLTERLRPPRGTREDPRFSATVEEFYDGLDDLFRGKVPFVYVLDSENALSSQKDDEQFQKEKAARTAEKEATGDYGTAKAKVHSNCLRTVANVKLRENGSILVIVSQTRQRIGFGAQFNPRTRSGGTALKFYAHLELWLSVKEDLTKQVSVAGVKKNRQLGILSKIKVEKSRLTGRESSVEVPIYWSAGIDDLGACVNWLVEEGVWQGTKATVRAPEFDFAGPKEILIDKIQDERREGELHALVARTWAEIQAACAVKRKSRYS